MGERLEAEYLFEYAYKRSLGPALSRIRTTSGPASGASMVRMFTARPALNFGPMKPCTAPMYS